MLPVVALVGRPNVGKSTLFNFLTQTRNALVADFPGLTRDRQYGQVRRGERPFLVVDTGGIIEQAEGIEDHAMRQVWAAMDEADLVLFMVDARAGINSADEAIARKLRKNGKPVLLVANKIDGLNNSEEKLAEFFQMGLVGQPFGIASSHGIGIPELLAEIYQRLPPPETEAEDDETAPGIRVAIIGRPNVGKSTLVNRLLGEERVVVFDQPGTTRDSIFIPFERDGKQYTLIDTAGIRRRSRVEESVEIFSIIKAMQAMEKAHVVVYLIDASEGVTDQDANLLGQVVESGRGLIIGLNKWDGLTPDHREQIKRQIDIKLPFLDFASKHNLSALHGTGVGKLLEQVDRIYRSAGQTVTPNRLTEILQHAQDTHQPPLVRGRRIRLKYAHQGGHNPPTIVIHGNQTENVPPSYKRFLIATFRKALSIEGSPIKLEFKTGDNPYKEKKNELNPRQLAKRKRMMKHVKK
ncbi:MAG: ribosome biogenesis GTPase Der [Candidatus Methylumidiphilus sp.]